MEDTSSIFKDRLNTAIKAKGYNNVALSDKAGLSQAAVGYYRKGRLPRGCVELVKLANALGCSIEDILEEA